jgi:large subunit ribosomal protein L3
MSPGILGKKIGMTQVFRPDGQAVPVTLLKAGPCTVVQRKTPATDGYDAVQLGLVEFIKPRRINKPATGHLKKAGVEGAKFLREFRLDLGNTGGAGDLKTGDQILVSDFKPKDMVDVIGVSKGRGFAGVVKRHHFRGGEGSHGSMFHRAPGSIGASSFPSRVVPGMRMGGHMGDEQVTVRNLEVIDVDTEDNVLVVKGAVPGPNGGYVVVRRAKR